MALAGWGTAALAASGLDFDRTFHGHGQPPQLHFRADYVLNGVAHETEVWRDRDQRLKRRTDDVLETFVFRPAGEPEWRMVVLDLQRRIRTDVDRTSLTRVGHFTDWFSLAHVLARPVGAYRLAAVKAPAGIAGPVAPCRWYALEREGAQSRICWSEALHVPLLITGTDGAVQWRVRSIDTRSHAADTYRIDDAGFVRNDASADIKGD